MIQANYEKLTPISQSLEPTEPTKARHRRILRLKCLAIAALLLIWWSYYSVQSLLGFGRDGDSIPRGDETKELDFDTVSQSLFTVQEIYIADLLRLFRVKSWNGTPVTEGTNVPGSLSLWTIIVL
jgi:hypothetical protein